MLDYLLLLQVFAAQPGIRSRSWSVQYRNAVFYATPEQARQAKAALENVGGARVDLEPLGIFTLAEDYHQKYFLQNSGLAGEFSRMFSTGEALANSTAAARVNGYLGGYGGAEDLEANLGRLGLSERGQQTLIRVRRKR